VLAAFCCACSANSAGSTETDAADCSADAESVQLEIFSEHCLGAPCHSGDSPAAGLDLESADLESRVVGVGSGTCAGWVRVVPGSPDESLLYVKVAGEPPCGQPMPIGGDPLDEEQLGCIADWIGGIEGVECETCGGDVCVEILSDAAHCGGCDQACPDAVACISGECECAGGGLLCGGQCVDAQSNPQHCGACDQGCVGNEVCLAGVCSGDCGVLTNCGGACVDPQADPNHCGDCDVGCGGGNSCVDGNCDCPGTGVSFSQTIEPLLDSKCTGMGCHSFPAPASFMNLSAGNSFSSLVGVDSEQCADRKRVAPSQPGDSYLMDKLNGVNLCFGTQMPKLGSVSQAEIDSVSEWICRGALDD
jgi:hypothetical protein